LHRLLGGLPRRTQHHDIGCRGSRIVGLHRTQCCVLGVIRIADTKGDVVAAVAPRDAQGAADVAGADDGDVDVGAPLRLFAGGTIPLPTRAYPMI
jgi:hypothetical protein